MHVKNKLKWYKPAGENKEKQGLKHGMNHSAVPSTSLKQGDYFLAANIHQGCDAKRYLVHSFVMPEHQSFSLFLFYTLKTY